VRDVEIVGKGLGELWEGIWHSLDLGTDDLMNFIKMFRNVMRIGPEERRSAKELLDEDWLKGVVV
jgi:hypothetical protein